MVEGFATETRRRICCLAGSKVDGGSGDLSGSEVRKWQKVLPGRHGGGFVVWLVVR